MANGEDPRVTDLRRYRKARERARRQPPPAPAAQGLLGRRRHAGKILVIVLALLALLWLAPLLLPLFR